MTLKVIHEHAVKTAVQFRPVSQGKRPLGVFQTAEGWFVKKEGAKNEIEKLTSGDWILYNRLDHPVAVVTNDKLLAEYRIVTVEEISK